MFPRPVRAATRVPRPDDDARDAARPTGRTGSVGCVRALRTLAEWLAGVQGQCPTRPLDRIRILAMAGAHSATAEISPLLPVSPPLFASRFLLLLLVSTLMTMSRTEHPSNAGRWSERSRPASRSPTTRSTAEPISSCWPESTPHWPCPPRSRWQSSPERRSPPSSAGTGIDDRGGEAVCGGPRRSSSRPRSLTDAGDVLYLLSPVGSAPLAALAVCRAGCHSAHSRRTGRIGRNRCRLGSPSGGQRDDALGGCGACIARSRSSSGAAKMRLSRARLLDQPRRRHWPLLAVPQLQAAARCWRLQRQMTTADPARYSRVDGCTNGGLTTSNSSSRP